tara:strand:+ start:287 stop:697 length:411 start_codon:yes stop_codon:yes gene_type:complete
MTEEFFPVTETVVFIRIVQYGEGRRGKFAVALVKHEENEFTLLLAEEEFPAAKARLIKEGQVLRVKPSQRGLRARIKDQDFKLFAENQERIAIEVSRFNDKLDAVENRQIERLNQFERIIEDLKRVIICWDDIHDD